MSFLPSSIFHYVVTLWLRASSNTLIILREFNCVCLFPLLLLTFSQTFNKKLKQPVCVEEMK